MKGDPKEEALDPVLDAASILVDALFSRRRRPRDGYGDRPVPDDMARFVPSQQTQN